MGFQLPTSIGEFTGFLPTYPSHSLLLSCLCKSKELGWHPSDVEVGSRGGWIRRSRSPVFLQQRIRIFQRKKILKSFKNSKFTSKKSVFVKNGRLYNYISTDVYFSRCISLKWWAVSGVTVARMAWGEGNVQQCASTSYLEHQRTRF